MPKNDKKISLEEKLESIEKIVNDLDRSELPLEDLIKSYEEGMKFAKSAKEELTILEQKVIDITQNYQSETNN
ncbi:MAG: exodeoxyribonuclease VII small subunit [Candidatus Kapaibacteriota bacterium]|jgi:exodeoxyribonuclease VII small subunit